LASPLLFRAFLALVGVTLAVQTAKFSGLVGSGPKVLVDFDAFHIAGRMVWRGEVEDAYRFAVMMQAQRTLGGADGSLPWTYPPPFNLVAAALALLPLGAAYFAFTAATLGAYLVVLRRLAGEQGSTVLLAIFPAVIVTIACGQNGFLTGALIGLACLGFLRDRPSAGVPLGLMIVKPHLAIAFTLYAVAARRWSALAIAALTAAIAATLATLAFGPGVWTAFLQGAAEARGFLEAGAYPLYRMISPYAALRSLGASALVSTAVHGVIALLALGMVWTAVRRRMAPAQILGLTALASLLVSPYAYDYDLPIAGIGLALVMPDLLRLTTGREQIALFGLTGFACLFGFAQNAVRQARFGLGGSPDAPLPATVAGLGLTLLVALVWGALQRDRAWAASAPPHAVRGAA
jgi:hypothetical protein